MYPPRTIMASKDDGSNLDFGFGFNDINFSDRVLRIDIIEGDNTCTSLTDILCGDQRERPKENDNELCHRECGIKVKTIHISSIILAAKSPFFLKLFSNGMKESEEHHVILRIDASEEVALMDLLNFMYSNTLSSSTTSSLIDVLMVADKFQVSSCIRYCIKLLCDLPMTCESASQFLHLPSSVMMTDEVQPLTGAAKKYLADYYKDFIKFEEEVMELPLALIEAILSSDNLQVMCEAFLYEFVLKWARKHYPIIEERREILTTRLAPLIRFKNMTWKNLKLVSSCNDFDPAYASKVVLEALIFKAESTQLHTFHTFHASRTYKLRPVKVLESMFPHPHCMVYLDLRKEECDNLYPSQQIYSELFCVGEKLFMLIGRLHSDSFQLSCCLSGRRSASCSFAYECSARSKPTNEFVSLGKMTQKVVDGEPFCFGFSNLFGVSWSQIIAPDSVYFINGVMYLKVEIAMKS